MGLSKIKPRFIMADGHNYAPGKSKEYISVQKKLINKNTNTNKDEKNTNTNEKSLKNKRSETNYYGLFCNQDLPSNTIIARTGGKVLNSVKDIPKTDRYATLIDENIYLAPPDYGNLGNLCFINHSCNSNMARIGGLILIAKRKILKGEELTLDYAPLIATVSNWSMECNCGSPNCRKVITGDDWQKEDLAQELWPEWLSFVQKKILKFYTPI